MPHDTESRIGKKLNMDCDNKCAGNNSFIRDMLTNTQRNVRQSIVPLPPEGEGAGWSRQKNQSSSIQVYIPPMGFPPKDNPEGFNNGGAWEVGKWLWCVFREQLWREFGKGMSGS